MIVAISSPNSIRKLSVKSYYCLEAIPYGSEAFSTLVNFGESISLSADGSRVAIGSRTDVIIE